MASNIGTLNILIGGSVSGLSKALNEGVKHVDSFVTSVSSAVTGIGGMFAGLFAGLTLGGIAAFTKSAIDNIGALKDSAAQIGLTTDALGRLQYAASLDSVAADSLSGALGKMLKAVADPSKEASAAFDLLGLNAKKLQSESPEAAFKEIADAMKGVENPAQRVQIAMAIFGKTGKDIIPLLAEGSAGLDAMGNTADKLGLTISQVDAETVDRAGDALDTVLSVVSAIGNQIAIFVAPIIEDLSNRFIGAASSGEGLGPKVGSALEWVAKGIAAASDYLYLLEAGFYGFRAGAMEAIGGVIDAIGFLAMSLETVLNKLPGVKVEFGDTLKTIADGFHQVAAEEAGKMNEALENFHNGKNSKAVEDYFTKVRDEAKKASEATVAAHKNAGTILGDDGDGNDKESEKARKKMEKEQERLNDKMEKDAERVKDAYATPFEKAQKELDNLITLYEAGKLTSEEFARAQEKLETDFGKGDKSKKSQEVQAPKLLASNSNEAFKVINEIQNRADGGNKTEEKQLEQAKLHTKYLEEISKQKQASDDIGTAYIYA